MHTFGPNSSGPLTNDWKVTDNSSINFHDMFFSFFAIIWQKMKKKTSWKFMDESSIGGPGEFGLIRRVSTFKVS